MLYLCRVKPLRHYLRGFLIAAWAGDKIAEFSFPEISFHFPLRPWFFFVSPAYAGKSWNSALQEFCQWDHPRVCGEKCALVWLARFRPGSPPRMRGKVEFARQTWTTQWDHPRVCGEKQDRVLRRVLRVGITPAYAGKSKESGCPESAPRDHPRVCGEKA